MVPVWRMQGRAAGVESRGSVVVCGGRDGRAAGGGAVAVAGLQDLTERSFVGEEEADGNREGGRRRASYG